MFLSHSSYAILTWFGQVGFCTIFLLQTLDQKQASTRANSRIISPTKWDKINHTQYLHSHYCQLDDSNWVHQLWSWRLNETSGLQEHKTSFTNIHRTNARTGFHSLSLTFYQQKKESDINFFVMKNHNLNIYNKKVLVQTQEC